MSTMDKKRLWTPIETPHSSQVYLKRLIFIGVVSIVAVTIDFVFFGFYGGETFYELATDVVIITATAFLSISLGEIVWNRFRSVD